MRPAYVPLPVNRENKGTKLTFIVNELLHLHVAGAVDNRDVVKVHRLRPSVPERLQVQRVRRVRL